MSSSTAFAAKNTEKRAAQVLDEVWNEISKRHFDKNFKQKNRKLYTKFKPVILKSPSDRQLAHEINKLLQALGQSHIALLPPLGVSASRALKAIKKGNPKSSSANKKSAYKNNTRHNSRKKRKNKNLPNVPADTGITVLESMDKLYVVRLRKGSPAAKAGIQIGDEITAINNIKLHPERKLFIGWALLTRALMAGRPGSEVSITVKGKSNKPRKYNLIREANGEKWFKFGVLPRSYSDFYATVLPGNIGYIHFTAFTTPMLQRFRLAIIGKLRNVKGLIVDMRGNVGGLLMYPPWLAAWCCPKTVSFGQLIMHGTPLKPRSFPQSKCFKGPLAILIDQDSYSCAEIFAAGMQDGKFAKLFGTTTSGKCLPSVFLGLPSGFRLQTITGSIIRVNGKKIEKIGVKPDSKVILSADSLRKGHDNVIETARAFLLKSVNKK